jgi:hypothetical protein
VIPNNTQTALAVTTAVNPLAGAVATTAVSLWDGVKSLFKGKQLTSWQQQHDVIVPVVSEYLAKMRSVGITGDLAVKYFQFAKTNIIEMITQGAGGIQGGVVATIYLPSIQKDTDTAEMFIRALHYLFHACPNFSDYEMNRRLNAFRSWVLEPSATSVGKIIPTSNNTGVPSATSDNAQASIVNAGNSTIAVLVLIGFALFYFGKGK